MNSPRSRAALDRVGQRAAGRRRVIGATTWTAAGGAALAVAFGAVFAQGAAADGADQTGPPDPPAVEDWIAPAAARLAPQPATEAPAPPATPPAPAPNTAPDGSTGGS